MAADVYGGGVDVSSVLTAASDDVLAVALLTSFTIVAAPVVVVFLTISSYFGGKDACDSKKSSPYL